MSHDLRRRSAPLVRAVGSALLTLLVAFPTFAGEMTGPARRDFDRTTLDTELARPLGDLRQQGPEALRSHVERLAEFYSVLDLAQGVSPEERRSLSDRILARVAQVGLLSRERTAAAGSGTKAQDGATRVTSWAMFGGAAGFLGEHSHLVIGLLGGLIVAYALGSLAGYRRGASQASYYGTGDPRLWFVARDHEGKRPAGIPGRLTLSQIRACLGAGRTVLLQLGYEIAPKRRAEFLRLMQDVQRALNAVDGHAHSVWEDPRHPNRFYEVIVCDRLEALDFLTGDRSELAGLDAKIEACWLPGGAVIRRAWCGILPARSAHAGRILTPASSDRSREEHVS